MQTCETEIYQKIFEKSLYDIDISSDILDPYRYKIIYRFNERVRYISCIVSNR